MKKVVMSVLVLVSFMSCEKGGEPEFYDTPQGISNVEVAKSIEDQDVSLVQDVAGDFLGEQVQGVLVTNSTSRTMIFGKQILRVQGHIGSDLVLHLMDNRGNVFSVSVESFDDVTTLTGEGIALNIF